MKASLLIIAALQLCLLAIGQPSENKSVVIGSMTTKNNAILVINPPNADQGVLLPQLSTSERTAIKPSSPSENGLTVFDTDLKSFFYWSDGAWVRALAENTVKTSFYAIDPIHFQMLKRNYQVDETNLVVFESDTRFVTASRTSEGEEAMAAVNIPHGAVIREVTAYYMDDDINGNLQIKLMRKNFSGDNETLIHWQSSGNSSAIRHETFSAFNDLGVIDLQNFTYRVSVIFDIDETIVNEPGQARQRIYGIKIKYQE